MEQIKLKVGHWYKFNDNGKIYIGQYIGNEDEFSCCVYGKGHKAKVFNVYYDDDAYESWGYGACHLPELLEDYGEYWRTILSDEIMDSYEFEYVDDDGNEFTWVAEGDQIEDACDKLNISRENWENYINDLWAYFEPKALEYKKELDFMAEYYPVADIPRI